METGGHVIRDIDQTDRFCNTHDPGKYTALLCIHIPGESYGRLLRDLGCPFEQLPL